MFEMSKQKAEELLRKYEAMSNKIQKAKTVGEERAGMLLGAGLTTGMAFVAAYANGRYSDLGPDGKPSEEDKFHLGPLPADLLIGFGTAVGGMVGFFGRYDHLAVSSGSGLMAGSLAVSGYRMGREGKAADRGSPVVETFNARDNAAGLPPFSSAGDAAARIRAARGY